MVGGTTIDNQPDVGGAARHICPRANKTDVGVVTGGNYLKVGDNNNNTRISINYVLYYLEC